VTRYHGLPRLYIRYTLLSLRRGFGAKETAKATLPQSHKFGSQFNSSEVCMSHRNHVGKVMAGLVLLLAVLFVAPYARTQAPPEDPPAGAEAGATPDPAQNQNPVSLSAKIDQSQLKPGQTAKLLITVKLEPGWHLYALTQPPPPRKAKVTIDESGVFKLAGEVRQPKPKIYQDPNFSEPGKPFMSQAFENEVTFTAPIKVASDAKAGAQKLIAKFSYQVCDDQTCLRPTTKTFEIETTIAGASVQAPPTKATPTPINAPAKQTTSEISLLTKQAQAPPDPPRIVTPGTSDPAPASTPETSSPTPTATQEAVSTMGVGAIAQPPGGAPQVSSQAPTQPPTQASADEDMAKDLKGRGLFGFVWFAVIQGLLALLTPCVFPMIPITVSFFTKRDQKSGGAAVGQAGFFSLGIIFTYTAIGLALAGLAGPTGLTKLASSPWMNLLLTALFVVFALNLFGMFEIKVPTGLVSKLDAQAQAGRMGTMFATILMGVTFTLTSFTCTTAFVGTVLIYATQGEWFWAVVGMLAFATAFAFPFFLFALFPRWLSSLPKSGGWLNSMKVVMGFLEIAAAFKFLSNVDLVWGWDTISRNLVLSAWIAIALVAAIYLLGKIQLPHDSPVERLGVPRMLFATSFFGVAFYLLTGLFGAPLGEIEAWLPPGKTEWIESYEVALQKARAENKPVFLNFTGVTCTNCRWMEKNMFPEPEVKKELSRFVVAELFTDREKPDEIRAADEKNAERQAAQFKSAALPLYVIISPDEKTLAVFPSLTRDKQEFIGFLQRGASRFDQQTARR
jgi:thiol:disulfide interchange protein